MFNYLFTKKIRLVHVFNDVSIVYYGLVVFFLKKVKFIVSIRHSGLSITGYKRRLISFVCRYRSNYIITNSHNGKNNLNKLYHLSKKYISVIHNGLDLEDYSNIIKYNDSGIHLKKIIKNFLFYLTVLAKIKTKNR